MQATLPGRPQSKLQAVTTGIFEGQTVLAYISGTALLILNGPRSLIQTIHHDDLEHQELRAVVYCPSTGSIAVAATRDVYIYALHEEIKGTLCWHYESSIKTPSAAGDLTCLSWGSDEELLVASDTLNLFSTHVASNPTSPTLSRQTPVDEPTKPIWTIKLPSPVRFAHLSPSASLIATSSLYDCFVKVWRRLSFESAEFEYVYLRHPATVTHLQWRLRGQNDQDEHPRDKKETLYTISADGKFRIWTQDRVRNLDTLCLSTEIDMVSAVQPRETPSTIHDTVRYAFTLPWTLLDQMMHGPQQSRSDRDPRQERHAQEYIKEITSRRPDIVVVVDGHGHMSAWGVEDVGSKKRAGDPPHASPFHIALVDGISFGFSSSTPSVDRYSQLQAFALPNTPGRFAILTHHFDGRLLWQETSLRDLCDPSVRNQRLYRSTTLTGHTSAVEEIIRSPCGTTVLSRTKKNECIVWKQTRSDIGISCQLTPSEPVHRTLILQKGSFVAFLCRQTLSIWDCRQPYANVLTQQEHSVETDTLCFLRIPSTMQENIVHLVTITADMQCLAWRVRLPNHDPEAHDGKANNTCSIEEIRTSTLDRLDQVNSILAVDPAGADGSVTESLDVYSRDVAISYSVSGILRSYAARVDHDTGTVEFLTTSTVETSVENPAMASATSIHKAALVDQIRTTLTIWDTKSGRLDHEQTFEDQPIRDLDWASTPDKQSVLAVGFAHRVLVFSQLRYDYVTDRPAWTTVKSIDLTDLTPHPIGDSVWLKNGNLVIGAGNALFVTSNTVSLGTDLSPGLLQTAVPHQGAAELFDLVSGLNGPLPVFHPQFVSQCILAGRLGLAQTILVKLMNTLRFYTEGDPMDPLLGISAMDFAAGHGQIACDGDGQMCEDVDVVTSDVAESLTTLLTEKSVPQLSNTEQFGLVDVVHCVATVQEHRRSVDDNAARYLLFWRQTMMRGRQESRSGFRSQKSTDGTGPNAVSWREITWAQHSSSQDVLTDLISRHHRARMTWQDARDAGLFMWLTDRSALLGQFEGIGRNAYTASEPKDPVACSLHYIALRKKAVLVGLWRMATWSREQNATMKLLRNDFGDARWKTAAAKNAYALMGKRRFEYAATFFLLADDLKSAVSVLSNQLNDLQLAVAVARVYGGDDSPELRALLQDKVLPLACAKGNRWQAVWAYWLLGQRANAVRSLVTPLSSLVADGADDDGESKNAKSFLNDDPALAVAYRQLREKSMQTLKGATMIEAGEEGRFVTKTATLLRRMGCDLLALDLVRNWEFLRPKVNGRGTAYGDDKVSELRGTHRVRTAVDDFSGVDPRRLLRRRSSLVIDDLPSPTSHKQSSPQGSNQGVASMLDGWDMPAVGNGSQQHRVASVLDGFDTVRVEKSAAVEESNVGPTDTKTTDVKINGSDDGADSSINEHVQGKRGKVGPRFQEPDPNSLLDAFGF